MNRLWLALSVLLAALALSACGGEALPLAVVQTQGEEQAQLKEGTPARALEVLTPTPGPAQPPVDSPTRLPPIDLSEMTGDSWLSISPDGNWTAQVQVAYPFDKNGVSTGEKYYIRLEVLKKDGSVVWTVLDDWSNWGLGYSIPANFHWRADSRRLYFTEQTIVDGCAVFGNERGLYEVNLDDGSLRELSGFDKGELQAAPSGERIAVLSGKALQIRDISGEIIAQASLDFLKGDWQAGKLIWSPDSGKVVFTVMFRPCGPPESSSIFSLDIASGSLDALIEQDSRVFVANHWLENGKIEVIDAAGAVWSLDPETKTLEKIE